MTPTSLALPNFAGATWKALEAADAGNPPQRFLRSTLDSLPAPAQRLLATALPEDTPLLSTVTLEMEGELKLAGRWLPFTATQFLRAGVGFVWAPIVGGRLIRFTGADALGPDGAAIEFRLHNRIPVVRQSGPDVVRSAIGRLAAETAVWLPHSLTPQAGAVWEAIDDRWAAVTMHAAGTEVKVEVAVDDDGGVESLGLQRWNGSVKPAGYAPFGGSVGGSFSNPDGVRIAGSGSVGWGWHTPNETAGRFFRYRVTNAAFGT